MGGADAEILDADLASRRAAISRRRAGNVALAVASCEVEECHCVLRPWGRMKMLTRFLPTDSVEPAHCQSAMFGLYANDRPAT